MGGLSLNQPLQLKEIEGTFEDLQGLVGDFFEIVQITEDIVCICNEKGVSTGLGNNFHDDRFGWIAGTCVFTSTKLANYEETKNMWTIAYLKRSRPD